MPRSHETFGKSSHTLSKHGAKYVYKFRVLTALLALHTPSPVNLIFLTKNHARFFCPLIYLLLCFFHSYEDRPCSESYSVFKV